MINGNCIKNNQLLKKFKDYIKRRKFMSGVAKTIVIAIVWCIALIPFWLYIITRLFIEPVGFWQEIALLAVSGALIGWIQVLALVFACIISISIIIDDS